jgi:hypothetical protein
MSFYEVANHPLIYVMVIIGIAFVAGVAVVNMRKSWKRALVKGYSHEKLMTLVRSSVAATIVPALAIVIGLFSLVALLGIPWPWWRLSVIGAVTYETMAADSAIKAVGLTLQELDKATAGHFVLIMYAMTIGIMGGLCVAPFIAKKIQLGSMNLKRGDKKWGALSSTTFFLVILTVFIVPFFLDYRPAGLVRLATFATSLIITVILGKISKGRLAVLKGFILAISLILAMGSSILWTTIFAK